MKRSRMTVTDTQGQREREIELVREEEDGGYSGMHELGDMTQMQCATERKRGGVGELMDSTAQLYSAVREEDDRVTPRALHLKKLNVTHRQIIFSLKQTDW